MNIMFKVLITLIALIIVIILGFILSKNGKPYSTVLFTFHKLIALAMIIYTFIYIRQHAFNVMSNFELSITLSITIICILVLFTTGALLSLGKLDYFLLKQLHLLVAIFLSVSSISFIYIFIKILSS